MEKEKKFRQYRSNQGRSPSRMETSYKMIGWSFMILVATVLINFILKLF